MTFPPQQALQNKFKRKAKRFSITKPKSFLSRKNRRAKQPWLTLQSPSDFIDQMPTADFLAYLCGFLETDGGIRIYLHLRKKHRGQPFQRNHVEWEVALSQHEKSGLVPALHRRCQALGLGGKLVPKRYAQA